MEVQSLWWLYKETKMRKLFRILDLFKSKKNYQTYGSSLFDPATHENLFTGETDSEGRKLLPSKKNPNVRRWQAEEEQRRADFGENLFGGKTEEKQDPETLLINKYAKIEAETESKEDNADANRTAKRVEKYKFLFSDLAQAIKDRDYRKIADRFLTQRGTVYDFFEEMTGIKLDKNHYGSTMQKIRDYVTTTGQTKKEQTASSKKSNIVTDERGYKDRDLLGSDWQDTKGTVFSILQNRDGAFSIHKKGKDENNFTEIKTVPDGHKALQVLFENAEGIFKGVKKQRQEITDTKFNESGSLFEDKSNEKISDTVSPINFETHTEIDGITTEYALYDVINKNDIVSVVKANAEYPNGKEKRKRNPVKYTSKTQNAVLNGYKGEHEFYGQAKDLINNATKIEGNTFAFKEMLKESGFKWNAFDKCWEKK